MRLGIEGEGKVTKVNSVKLIECRDRSWLLQVLQTVKADGWMEKLTYFKKEKR